MTCWKDHALAATRRQIVGRAPGIHGICVALLLVVSALGGLGPAGGWGGPARASAQATNVEHRALANSKEMAEATRGPKFNVTAGAFFRSPQDHVGFSLAGDFYYDFRLGPLVLAPGGRLSAYIIRDFFAFAGFATLRAGLTLGPVLPYLMGGAGFGYIGIGGQNDAAGVSYLGGGGLLVHVRKRLAFGLEASYQGFALTHFAATYLGANMQFSY